MTNPKVGGAWMEVGAHNMIGVAMADLLEVERIALEKELREEIAMARRRKLMCF
jgi:hypothetical protein